MEWALFLDDERYLTDDELGKRNWIYARTFFEACHLVHRLGCPNFISFDHDLSDGPTGYKFAKWLTKQNMDRALKWPCNFAFRVHSQNPIGKMNIERYLDAFIHSEV